MIREGGEEGELEIIPYIVIKSKRRKVLSYKAQQNM